MREQFLEPGLGALDLRRPADGQRKVHAVHERAGVRPGIGRVLVSGWGLALVQGHPQVVHRLDEHPCVGELRAGRADGADDELEGRFHFRAVAGRRQKFRRREQQRHHRPEVTLGIREPSRKAIDEMGGWNVADKMARELARDESSRRGVAGQDIENLLAITEAASGL